MTRRTRRRADAVTRRHASPRIRRGAEWRGGAMLGCVLEALTGTGLAASAGLNAYIPLLVDGPAGPVHRR